MQKRIENRNEYQTTTRSKMLAKGKIKVKWYMTRHCDGFRSGWLHNSSSVVSSSILRANWESLAGFSNWKQKVVLQTAEDDHAEAVMINMVIMTFLFVLFSHGLGLPCKSKAAPTAFSNPASSHCSPVAARGKSVWEFTLGGKTFILKEIAPMSLQPSVCSVTLKVCLLEAELHIEGSFGTQIRSF